MNKFEIENKLKDNKLPEGWAKVKLDSLLIESKERNITNKKLLVFSITNVKGFVLQDEYFSHNIHSEKTTNYKIFRENYFGYNPARINVGSIALSEKQREGLLSPMYVIFKTKSTLNPKYLKYFMQTSHFKNNVVNNVAGSVRESLNYSSLEMFDFIYPISISEQNRIAELLKTVDEAIDKTDAIVEKYKRIKQGLMQDLLTRGITAFEFEKDKLIAAVKKVFDSGDHRFGREENLVSHLSRHLDEFFLGWDVDSEVEKNNERQRPDIIIHKRGTDNNLFAIEVKKNDNLNAIKEDIKKLEDVMLEDYHYEDTIFIGFDIENFEDIFKLSEKVNFILVSRNGEIKVKSRVRRFKESTLGRIPVEWEVATLESLCEKIADRDHTTPKYVDYGIRIVSPKDFDENEVINFENCAMISLFDHLINKKKTDIRTGDIIFTRIGAGLGKSCLATEKMPEFSILHSAALIRSNKKNAPLFLLYSLKSFYLQKQISDGIQSIGVPDLGMDKMQNLKLRVPINIDEQWRIAEILSQIDETIEKEQSYKNKYERLRQGLMEDLLTGKARVNHLIEEGGKSVQKTG